MSIERPRPFASISDIFVLSPQEHIEYIQNFEHIQEEAFDDVETVLKYLKTAVNFKLRGEKRKINGLVYENKPEIDEKTRKMFKMVEKFLNTNKAKERYEDLCFVLNEPPLIVEFSQQIWDNIHLLSENYAYYLEQTFLKHAEKKTGKPWVEAQEPKYNKFLKANESLVVNTVELLTKTILMHYKANIEEEDHSYWDVISYLLPYLHAFEKKKNQQAVMAYEKGETIQIAAINTVHRFVKYALFNPVVQIFCKHFDLRDEKPNGFGLFIMTFCQMYLNDKFVAATPEQKVYFKSEKFFKSQLENFNIAAPIEGLLKELSFALVQNRNLQNFAEEMEKHYNFSKMNLNVMKQARDMMLEELSPERFLGDIDAPLSLYTTSDEKYRLLIDQAPENAEPNTVYGSFVSVSAQKQIVKALRSHSNENERKVLRVIKGSDGKNTTGATGADTYAVFDGQIGFKYHIKSKTISFFGSAIKKDMLKILTPKMKEYLSLKILSVLSEAQNRDYEHAQPENQQALKDIQTIVDELIDVCERPAEEIRKKVEKTLNYKKGIVRLPGIGVLKTIKEKVDASTKEESTGFTGIRAPHTRTLPYGHKITAKTFYHFKSIETKVTYDLKMLEVDLINPKEAQMNPEMAQIRIKKHNAGRKCADFTTFITNFEAFQKKVESKPYSYAFLQTSICPQTAEELEKHKTVYK